MSDLKTYIAIIGAGPAGCSTSIFLSKLGISHILFEKGTFPRDKVCGDALRGDRSIVRNVLSDYQMDRRSYCAGIRAYYENVSDFQEGNFIELHFLKETLPGYLWIFPLSHNRANVGIGMLSSYMENKQISLKKVMQNALKTHPNIRDELNLSYQLSKLIKYPWLFNFVVNRALKNETVRNTMSCMFENLDIRSKLRSPSFYFKLLFNLKS